MKIGAWRISKTDDVAVVLEAVNPGDTVVADGEEISARQPIPQGHKIAVRPVAAGEMVKKYGVPIGQASQDIQVGDHVHTQNMDDVTEALCKEYYEAYRRKEAQ